MTSWSSWCPQCRCWVAPARLHAHAGLSAQHRELEAERRAARDRDETDQRRWEAAGEPGTYREGDQ